MIIAIDFDGTIVDHRYPIVGDPVPGAIEWMLRFQELGAQLILYTMRSDGREDGFCPLNDAVEHCRKHGVEFWGLNTNPEQHEWTTSPKAYARVYIDDAAFGCPLAPPIRDGGRRVVDWEQVGPAVERLIKEDADL